MINFIHFFLIVGLVIFTAWVFKTDNRGRIGAFLIWAVVGVFILLIVLMSELADTLLPNL